MPSEGDDWRCILCNPSYADSHHVTSPEHLYAVEDWNRVVDYLEEISRQMGGTNVSSQEMPGISSAWHWELLHTVYEVPVAEVGQAFWHVLVKPHFPDPSSHASRQELRKAILAMVADGRMPVPLHQIRVSIP